MDDLAKAHHHQARYAEFARKGGPRWEGGGQWETQRARPLGEEDAGRNEIFAHLRSNVKPVVPPELVRRRVKTDVIPFVDTASPLSLSQQGMAMGERSVELTERKGPKNDGTFAGLLKSPRPHEAHHAANLDIAPFNDGSANAHHIAIARGRYSSTQTKLSDGSAALLTET